MTEKTSKKKGLLIGCGSILAFLVVVGLLLGGCTALFITGVDEEVQKQEKKEQVKNKEAKKPVEIKINLASSNNSEIIDTLKTDELVSKTKDMDMNIELFERYMKNKDRLQKERYGE